MTMLQDFRQSVSHFVAGQRKRWRLERELAQLEAMGSLDAVLADAGLVRSQIEPLIAGCAESAELLDKMLVRLGLDSAQLPVESLRDMTWACTTCPHRRQCRQWLSSRGETEIRTFCPNAEQLEDALAKQRPGVALPTGGGPNDGGPHPNSDELRQMRADAYRREARLLLDTSRFL